MCRDFPNYTVEYSGVGVAPSSCTSDIGPCSQIAIFTRQGHYLVCAMYYASTLSKFVSVVHKQAVSLVWRVGGVLTKQLVSIFFQCLLDVMCMCSGDGVWVPSP